MGLPIYDVEIGGHKTRMQLSDVDAERMGLKVIEHQPMLPFPYPDLEPDPDPDPDPEPAPDPDPEPEVKGRPTVSNKMRGLR